MVQGISAFRPDESLLNATRQIGDLGLEGSRQAGQAGKVGAPSFQDMLTNMVKQVDQAQQTADTSLQAAASGQPVALQDVVLKMEEADLAFRMMKEVRDKLLTAYKEIIATQV